MDRLLIPAPEYPNRTFQGFSGKAFTCHLFRFGLRGDSLQMRGDLRGICDATCSLLGQMAQVSGDGPQGAGVLAGEADRNQEVTCSTESLF